MRISRVYGASRPSIRKTLRPDGTEIKKKLPDGSEVSPIDWPTHWYGTTREVTIDNVAALYEGIEPHECLVLGGAPDGRHVTRLRRTDFRLPPTDLMVLDVDGMPYVEGHSDETLRADPENTIRAQLAQMFGAFADQFHIVVALSSRAGFTGDFRAHVWLGVSPRCEAKEIAAVHKRQNVDWLDTGIFQAGRVLFAAPPDIEDDPFPIRVFEFKGEDMVIDLSSVVQSTEGLVELRKQFSRGKHGLYKMNSGPLHAGEGGVSGECWNFILSCKRSGMTEDEAIAALHDEFTRLEVPAATWKRMRKVIKRPDGVNDPALGEARRMYRDMRAGETLVYGVPAYREPETTLTAASEALRRAVRDQIDREGVFLNKVTLGVGKTHEIVELVTSRDVKALILAPNHERCAEIVNRLNDAREKRLYDAFDQVGQFEEIEDRWLERPWASWLGRSAEGMCSRLEAVNAAFRAGVSVHKHICGFPTPDEDGDAKRCPCFATCAYADQVMNFWRYNWVAPVAMISHLSRIASDADVVIIDEGCVEHLAGNKVVPLEDLLAPRPGRLGELSRKAHCDLLEDTQTLTFDEVQEALELELEEKPAPHVEPDMTDEQIIANCEPGSYRSGCVSIWRAMLARMEGGENHLHVFAETKKDDNGEEATRWWVDVAWRRKPRLLEKVDTVLLFDATPNEVALRAHWPELEVFEVEAPKLNTRVVQVSDAVGKRSQLINDLPKTDPQFKAEETRVKKARQRLADWLRAQPGYTVVVTKKDHREAIEKEHRFDRVAFAHHGAVEGKDVWDFPDGKRLHGVDVDNLVILGRNAPQPYHLEAIARRHHADEDAVKTMGWYRTENWELGGGVAGYRLRHDDPRVDAVLKNVAVDSLMQAVGRMRSVRREKMGRVFVMHSMRLDIEVDECVSAEEVMRRTGDMTLLSASEVDRVFGAGGRNTREIAKRVTATHKYRMKDKASQPKPYLCAIAAGADVDQCMADLGAVWWEAVSAE